MPLHYFAARRWAYSRANEDTAASRATSRRLHSASADARMLIYGRGLLHGATAMVTMRVDGYFCRGEHTYFSSPTMHHYADFLR